jgi:WD40 repeat protein
MRASLALAAAAVIVVAGAVVALGAQTEQPVRVSPSVVAIRSNLLYDVRFAPDSRALYAVDSRSSLLAVGADGRQRRIKRLGRFVQGAALAPDARRLVQYVERDGARLELRRRTDGALLARTAVAGYRLGSFRAIWSPDGSRFVAELETRDGIQVFDGTTGRRLRTIRPYSILPQQVWAADGRRLLLPVQGGAQILDVASGERRRIDTRRAFPRALSPDGQRIAVNGNDGAAIIDAADGTRTPLPVRFADHAAFSPDGRRLAIVTSTTNDDRLTVGFVDLAEATLRFVELESLRGEVPEEPLLNWSPDGRRLAFSYGALSP